MTLREKDPNREIPAHQKRAERRNALSAMADVLREPDYRSGPGDYLHDLAELFEEPERGELLARLASRRDALVQAFQKARNGLDRWQGIASCGLQMFGLGSYDLELWIECPPWQDPRLDELSSFVRLRCSEGGTIKVTELFQAFLDWRRAESERTKEPSPTTSFADDKNSLARAILCRYDRVTFYPIGSGGDADPVLTGIALQEMTRHGA
jgi:hypothetical protein